MNCSCQLRAPAGARGDEPWREFVQGNPQKSRIGATDVSLTEMQRERVSRWQCGVAELSWRLGVSELDGAARQHEPRHGARAGCQDLPSITTRLRYGELEPRSLAMSRASLPIYQCLDRVVRSIPLYAVWLMRKAPPPCPPSRRTNTSDDSCTSLYHCKLRGEGLSKDGVFSGIQSRSSQLYTFLHV